MTNLNKQIFSVFAAGSMMLSVSTPAFASTTIQISGNGAGSQNAVTTTQTTTTTVNQTNSANVTNNVTSNANTGGNDAKFNTGGDVTIKTGAAETTTNVTNNLNSNVAKVAGCNCAGGVDVKIADNGANSKNQVNPLTVVNATTVNQSNGATVTNKVDSKASTGENDANSNTGGKVTIVTGAAKTDSNVKTTANSNSAVIGGGLGATVAPTASFQIVGNGAGSDNWISANLVKVNTLNQGNSANVTNNVTSTADSGQSDANFNTGGDVTITTGMATSHAGIDNNVNFNVANIDCGCTWDVLAKIAGNGAGEKSNNTILLGLTNLNTLGQGNGAELLNNATAKAATGENDALSNTGSGAVRTDPSIVTGPATNTTNVRNNGNFNTIGSTPVMVTLPGGGTLGVSFNLQALLAFFGLSMV